MGQVPQVVTNEPKATVVSDGTDGTDEIVVLIDDEGQVAHESPWKRGRKSHGIKSRRKQRGQQRKSCGKSSGAN